MRTKLGIGTVFGELVGQAAVDLIELAVAPAGIVEIPPRSVRQLLFTFRWSIQGRIPEILGENKKERIETLVVLLDGTSEDELNTILEAASEALRRLEAQRRLESQRPSRSSRRDRSDYRQGQRRRSAA